VQLIESEQEQETKAGRCCFRYADLKENSQKFFFFLTFRIIFDTNETGYRIQDKILV
jgi:hypothetical protein